MIDSSIKEREKANETHHRLLKFVSFLRIVGGGGGDGAFISVDFSTGYNTALINGSGGAAGFAQKLDNTFQSFPGGVLRKTDRGLLVEPASQNFVAASSDFQNAAWGGSTFAGKVNKISVIPGQVATEFESNTTGGLVNQGSRGTFTAGIETLWALIESMPSATVCDLRMGDQTNGNIEILSMSFNFSTKVITQRGNATLRRFGYIDLGLGPNGGNLFFLILSGLPTTAGNTRRLDTYPNGLGAGAAGRKTVFHHIQYEERSWGTSPIINPSTISLTRNADAITISVPTGTYNVRATTQDGTINDRYAISSVANLLTIPTDITENVSIQPLGATLQEVERNGHIVSISIWNQGKNAHGLGDSFLSTSTYAISSPYTIPQWLPSKLYRPTVWTFDGVGSTDLTQQATRFDSTPQYYGDILIIVDGAISSTFAQAQAAIESMIAHLTGTKQWLYVQPGLDAISTHEIGTAYYNTWLSVQNAIRAAYPNNYVETLPTMLLHGDGSANDISDIANGWWPRSLRFDSIHPNNLGSMYYAQRIANAIQLNRW